jgi:hypothetical protein
MSSYCFMSYVLRVWLDSRNPYSSTRNDLLSQKFGYLACTMNQSLLKKGKKKINIRALFDWIMGLIYFAVGLFLVVSDYLGIKFHFPPREVAVIFGALAALYGLFRCYRGYVSFYPEEE